MRSLVAKLGQRPSPTTTGASCCAMVTLSASHRVTTDWPTWQPGSMILESIASVFTISTGLVLAVGAFLAFLVQRARYSREIKPDIRIENRWSNVPLSLAGGVLGIPVSITVVNRSSPRAFNIRFTATIRWVPGVASPPITVQQRGLALSWGPSETPEMVEGEPTSLLAVAVSAVEPPSTTDIDLAAVLVGVTHYGNVEVSFESEADLAHRFMSRGRSRFRWKMRRTFALQFTHQDQTGQWSPAKHSDRQALQTFGILLSLTGNTESG